MAGEEQSRPLWRSPRSLLVIAVACLAVALLTYGLIAQGASTAIDEALSRGEAAQAPAFELADLGEPVAAETPAEKAFALAAGDSRVALDELRGRPLVLNFWASWCSPCASEAPLLERTWQDVQGDGVLFIGLNMQDNSVDAERFLSRYSVTYPSIKDPSSDTADQYGVTGIPETFFIDEDGRVVAHVAGEVNSRQLEEGIAAAVSGEVVPVLLPGTR